MTKKSKPNAIVCKQVGPTPSKPKAPPLAPIISARVGPDADLVVELDLRAYAKLLIASIERSAEAREAAREIADSWDLYRFDRGDQ